MHVAVAHQREVRIDSLGGKGLGQGLIDRNILHRCCLCGGETFEHDRIVK